MATQNIVVNENKGRVFLVISGKLSDLNTLAINLVFSIFCIQQQVLLHMFVFLPLVPNENLFGTCCLWTTSQVPLNSAW